MEDQMIMKKDDVPKVDKPNIEQKVLQYYKQQQPNIGSLPNNIGQEELGAKLVNFARSRNVMMEFRVIPSSSSDGFTNVIEQLRVQNLIRPELRSAFNYLWIPYDTVDTFLPRGSKQRQWYEADICWKIENVIAHEGVQRLERLEPKSQWVQRMRNGNFRSSGFSEEAVTEVKNMLDEHAAGWGLKRDEEDLVLGMERDIMLCLQLLGFLFSSFLLA
ncbi:hypothetical protein HAX54_047493 [Datura stramonium]|uniref:Uncharacterized protein n=1 Tax=Datura stramonium TaxID=4076 RepID=A0ABS8WKA6_DATST|nr:hypothetical protein [Datura stramonium]